MTADGRNRWAACQRAGVEPRTVEWDGKDANGASCSPFAYVWSLNGERRQLEAGQRGAIYLKVKRADEGWQAERKAMQDAANEARRASQVGKPKPRANVAANVGRDVPPAPARPAAKPRGEHRTRQQVAAEARVSTGTAQALLALPEPMLDRVAAGELTLPQARREVRRAEVVANLERVAAQEVAALEARVAELARPRPVDPLAVAQVERRRARLRLLAQRLLDVDPRRAGRLLWSTWRA